MQDFFVGTLGHMQDVDLPLSADGGPEEFCYRDAAPYIIAAAPTDKPDWAGGTGPWYQNWGQIYQATWNKANDCDAGTDIRSGHFPYGSSYYGNLQPAVAYAVDYNVPGAREAYLRMTGASNGYQIVKSFTDEYPVWSVKPRSL
ncbi:MAG: hypothetical protein HY308_14290 [Gammaproteobacteria bacterium]|nr:hypothetical protein [Gammaproteobacteria bacterium]